MNATLEQEHKALDRTKTKIEQAKLEKEAKANGFWDYRNNKIVEA